MTAILGISAFYHDSAAALVVDGRIVAAAQEERFTRRKHDPGFPERAVAWCLSEAGLKPGDLHSVAYYEKPLTKFDRLLETYLSYAPAGFGSFRRALPVWLREKLHIRRTLQRAFTDGRRKVPLVFMDHHESHAASAFFPCPWDEAAILTIDGVGEWSTATFGRGEGNRIRLEAGLQFPHSLGLLYSAMTYYCGFKVNSGEYKLMGLAPYGQPVHAAAIREKLIRLRPDGSFAMNMEYFNYCQGLTMTGEKFHDLFGGPPRRPESPLEQRHMDLAASIQAVTEDIVLRMGEEVHRRTGLRKLVMAGGVALNCVANGRLLREGPFEDIWIQPAAGDAGGALGAALFTWHQLMDGPRKADGRDSQRGSLLGPRHAPEEILTFLRAEKIPHEHHPDEATLLERVAGLMAEGKIVGWFHGRMEFGPRALGARSIIGDPRQRDMQAAMNLKIKFRESFRPFAPCVLRERAADYFELASGHESPYMLIVAPVKEAHRVPLSEEDSAKMASAADLRERVNVVRSTLPAITHVDWSARVQTVDEERHGRFCRLIRAFERRTGVPVIVNTSFNVRGEPIVCLPQEALRCFLATDMDVLVLEDAILLKEQMNAEATSAERARYLEQFELD